MNLRIFSYRFAEEILQHTNYEKAYDEILMVCKQCPLPVYKGKSQNQRTKDVVQQLMNTYFKLRFESLGWESEPLATPDESEDSLRSDFRKTFFSELNGKGITIQVEVEFGNVASSYRNYFKFQLSFSNSLTDICLLIVPTQKLSIRIDSGVSNFEKTIREIPSAKLSITVPILVIGLDDIGVLPWDVKSIQNDLNILKGNSRANYPLHCRLVNEYIASIENE